MLKSCKMFEQLNNALKMWSND